MSDSYRPQPWQTQNPTPAPAPMRVQVNVKLPADVSHSDKIVLMDVAHKIVNGNAPQVDRFVATNRQQVSIVGGGYYKRSMTGDGLDAHYINNNGDETLRMNVYPTGGGQDTATTSDTNLDGYILWIHGEPNYPLVTGAGIEAVGPYAVFMNSYQLEPSIMPSQYFNGGNCSAYAVLFGKTALLCASYTGDVEKKNALISSGNFKPPFKMMPDSPGSYAAGSEVDGTNQDNRAKKFGYFLFDWMNDFNPCSFIRTGNPGDFDYGGYRWTDYIGWSGQRNQSFTSGSISVPNVWGGIYFPDTTAGKSPLVPKGVNTIGVVGAVNSFATCLDCFVAEFYDRGKYMTVSQSWTVPQRPNQSIAANNTPLLFGVFDYQVGYSTGLGSNMALDLTPANTKNPPDYLNPNGPNENMMGPHDFFRWNGFDNAGLGPGGSINDTQAQAIAQWKQENQQLSAQYNTKIQNLITQWQSDYSVTGQYATQWTQTENVQSWWLQQVDANGKLTSTAQSFYDNDLVWAADDDNHQHNAGILQQYLFCWNAAYTGVNPLPRAAARYLYTWNFGHPLLVDANGNPSLNPVNYNGSFFGGSGQAWMTYQEAFDLADQYVKDHQQNMYLRQQDALDQIFASNPPPKALPFPGVNGDLPFTYQRFTNWSYTQ